MTPSQRLPASLTPLDAALAALLRDLAAVAPVELPPAQAIGFIAAEMPALPAVPSCNIAAVDGWALHAHDLIGASSYTPLPLTKPPVWVEAGDAIPSDCDCVIDSDAVDLSGPAAQVLAEAIPGQGVRRSGGDIAQDSFVATGQPVRALDLLVARAAKLQTVQVRRPRLRIVNIPSTSGQTTTAELIADSARAAGADIIRAESAGRDAASVSAALVTDGNDLLVAIGGSGVGRSDAGVAALARRGDIIAHGIALQPGRTSAVGRIGKIPVIVLPGAPDQALAAWWTLALPALDRLSGRRPRSPLTLPLARKVASLVGIAEIVLLERRNAGWMPLSVGEMPLAAIARADAWLAIPDGSEGHAAGTPVDAYMLRD
ncbi:MAG: molybdopterin-binding protein [Bradyrhizobium sp.]|uniref:molybdopterin-binding protein n=1 Tax=Bradyrhizobium sp. TaxID=376 RepID=UPI001C2A46A7|nr:molybdopterin-binding protein [Bradyrhizobium sp.]MBU6461652.1 molybdopterin-binding protein [Pseudomonadota bacterium]MDE2067558.1 molybdopterin-binding protein [Bradyrhizobium sp.]MDE2241407.1 molybdopterin-binding protein [Bradyrhizobium sp.]MDE2467717.1 molybdopterin-binding protein [Bradyrhizobium sp.]